ncbi:cobyrinate a,c-diamide synthase [Alteribacter natronophilus]|uniref:cobyrinate a,c-diamide synthase n=1 Tax=Alteribacter natronophilus TaxID=2583810 RepID=UPI00110E1BF3|nr:cobyrinate a,c-diamide synthase [Alteribacter natronophilus]TMW73439.1 cobyrinate a,c-diamide synthase [Alteribacter natronophilus]
MTNRRIVIAGTESGAGKTTITLGLMAALKDRGWCVQGFKCGPDFIDPAFHTAVTGRVSRNLDTRLLGENAVKEVLDFGSRGADIAVIEGVMGMYDGADPLSDEGSTAHIAALTGTPVILVVNCEAQARSAAAVVKGFQLFSDQPRIAGVILNRVGGSGHYELVKAAVEKECSVPVLGYLKANTKLHLPERHLGLVPSQETKDLPAYIKRISSRISETVDLERLAELAVCPEPEYEPVLFRRRKGEERKGEGAKIAVARDEAFHFYYEENLDLLKSYGAECIPFSPLHDSRLPEEVTGIYFGGGFPEAFAAQLAENREMLRSVREKVENNVPVIAECGGFMYLCKKLVDMKGKAYNMAGVIEGNIQVHHTLQSIRYLDVTGNDISCVALEKGESLAAHEFHYSSFSGRMPDRNEFPNLFASYSHLHFGSCPEAAGRFAALCSPLNRNSN